MEIVRKDVLERVFFKLPEACVASGGVFEGSAALGEKTIAEMYVMDQLEDFDTKNRDWLMNMAHIAETHQFQVRTTQIGLRLALQSCVHACGMPRGKALPEARGCHAGACLLCRSEMR